MLKTYTYLRPRDTKIHGIKYMSIQNQSKNNVKRINYY